MRSQVHKSGERGGVVVGLGGRRRETGDKPNYLLRIRRKSVINCGDPAESWRFSKARGAGGRGDKSVPMFTVFNRG